MGFGFRKSNKGSDADSGSLVENPKKSSSSVFKKGTRSKSSSQDDMLPSMDITNALQQVMCELTLFSDVSYMKDILEVDSFQKEVQSLGEACVGSVQRGPDGQPSYLEELFSTSRSSGDSQDDDESESD